ncbi:MAG TPA: hypothetical protein VN200_02615 [Rhodoglobus sp.]|nr:hypothetical protein [Rhodoglobus sp.]
MIHDLPPVEEWWPTLSIELKHKVLDDLDAPLDRDVIDAIRPQETDVNADGYDVIRLSAEERQYIREQTEQVD